MLLREIPGHTALKLQLLRNVAEGRISHAQLFSGPEGSGALPLALAFAQYIACEQRSGDDSCGSCPSCLKMNKLIHPDLHFSLPVNQEGGTDSLHTTPFLSQWREVYLANPWLGLDDWVGTLDIGNKQPFISAYEAHEIIKALNFAPVESEYRFLVIWLPEKMRMEAANRLLKTIEEPPEKTLIMLITQEYDSLLKTILSRTQLVKVNRLTIDEASEILQHITGLESGRCKLAAEVAQGNVVQARWLLQHGDEAEAQLDLFRNWMQSCYGFMIADLLRLTDLFAKESREWQKSFFAYALYIIRQTLLMNHEAKLSHVTPSEHAFIDKFRRFFHPLNYSVISGYIDDAVYHTERNAHSKILFFDLSLLIADVFRKEKEKALKA
jgi:DNA polymerase III subunit delta'